MTEIMNELSNLSEVKSQAEEVTAEALRRLRARVLDQQQVIEQMQHDWKVLNGHLTAYANDKDMCTEYEETLTEWNEDFSLMRLEGRMFEYDVPVRITVEYCGVVRVKAMTEADAVETAASSDEEDVLKEAGNGGLLDSGYETVTWDATRGCATRLGVVD